MAKELMAGFGDPEVELKWRSGHYMRSNNSLDYESRAWRLHWKGASHFQPIAPCVLARYFLAHTPPKNSRMLERFDSSKLAFDTNALARIAQERVTVLNGIGICDRVRMSLRTKKRTRKCVQV